VGPVGNASDINSPKGNNMLTRDKELERSINTLKDEMRYEFRSLKQKINSNRDKTPSVIPTFKDSGSSRYQYTDGIMFRLVDFVLNQVTLIASVVMGVLIAAKILNLF
jgi:hypothetical protein